VCSSDLHTPVVQKNSRELEPQLLDEPETAARPSRANIFTQPGRFRRFQSQSERKQHQQILQRPGGSCYWIQCFGFHSVQAWKWRTPTEGWRICDCAIQGFSLNHSWL